jgi:hypothetical protein
MLLFVCLQDVFCYENVQELGQQAGIITADRPVLCKPSKHVSAVPIAGWQQAGHHMLSQLAKSMLQVLVSSVPHAC